MSNSQNEPKLKPVAAAFTTIITSALALGGIASANANPFQVTELGSGYMQLAEGGSCGEGKCGAAKGGEHGKAGHAKDAEGKCGGAMGEADKGKTEGSCGGAKDMDSKGKTEGSCGGAKGD